MMRRTPFTIALAALALCAPAPGSPLAGEAEAARLGIDVSRFNGAIDWQAVAGEGVSFAFVAASRGSGADCAVVPDSCGADPRYDTNYAAARAAGVRVGPYHRAFIGGGERSEVLADARAEADVFIASVGALRRGDLRPALDVETPFDVPDTASVRLWVRKWVKRVRKQLGARPLIYTNATSWAATDDTREFAKAGHLLWVANWSVSRPAVPARNWAGKGWVVWQFTSSGRLAGVKGRVDLNRLRGRFKRIAA
jgi:lysozyme